ncbi:nitrogen regulation protein NR(II) [Alteromonas oceanisediminis]|uniref:nitrogen regulation protein NR(II) n=1 Tax=Alteromonas oceanisediminis TaxID=2836180 RepID=UPI001BDB5E08|nr:nitrogen regulation protein NR(II) [Alteromonas oceanisediminis]MBT0585203.1 nitrogen regulation protein NR(II) [Alteromonas oceanisediminis]
MTIDIAPITDNLNTAIIVVDQQFNITFCNFSAQRIFERSLNQLIGSSLREHFVDDIVNQERLAKALHAGEEFTENEVQLHFRDKRYVLVDFTVTGFPLDAQPHLIFEVRRIDKQKRISQENLQHAQQNAAKELIRGLAHEIKNPLGGIRGAAQLLGKTLYDVELTEYTAMIIEQADRLRNLVDRLLGPNTLPRFRVCNLHQSLEQVRTLINADLHFPVTINRDYDPSIPDMNIDPDMIQQAVINIVKNAQQALRDARVKEPVITLVTRIERQMMIHGKRCPLSAQIKIIDNGPGIPTEVRDTLFYPMVSSKQDGSGLGLSISQTLIDHHGGKIEVDSHPGHTEFTLYIPIKHEPE